MTLTRNPNLYLTELLSPSLKGEKDSADSLIGLRVFDIKSLFMFSVR